MGSLPGPCPVCGVRVSDDAARDRRRRLGKIDLACSVNHPLASDEFCAEHEMRFSFAEFPVAPIAFRVGPDGRPNGLGRRYEAVVTANAAVFAALPPRNHADHLVQSIRMEARPEGVALHAAVADVIGVRPDGKRPTPATVARDTLLWLLFDAILNLDADVSSIARACGCCVKIEADV